VASLLSIYFKNADISTSSSLFLGEGQPFVRSKVFPSPKTSSFPKDCLGEIAASLAICLRTPFFLSHGFVANAFCLTTKVCPGSHASSYNASK